MYGFTIYTFTIGSLERWVGEGPQRIAGFFVGVIALWLGLSVYRRRTQDQIPAIVYEDNADPLVQQLNLT